MHLCDIDHYLMKNHFIKSKTNKYLLTFYCEAKYNEGEHFSQKPYIKYVWSLKCSLLEAMEKRRRERERNRDKEKETHCKGICKIREHHESHDD